ncbi:MAG TPA: PAS domain S-box protein [Candidatus Angelobacter sp.]|nr:PAS domain S-box protein [Candidatus Angelobacter sp.]
MESFSHSSKSHAEELGTAPVRRTVPSASLDAIELLFNRAPVGFHSVGADGTFLQVNDTELAWLGYTREELVGKKKVQELLTEEGQAKFHHGFPQLKVEGSARDVELVFVRKDGTLFPVVLNSTAVIDADDGFLMSCSVLYDMAQRAGVDQAALRFAAERRFQRLLEAAPDAILEIDSHGCIALANETAERMFGYSRDELHGQNVEMLVPSGMRGAHREHRSAYAQHPRSRPMGIGLELHAQKKDGTLFPVEISLSPFRTEGDTSVIAVVRDVTEHHRAQDLLHRSEERLRQAEKLEALARLAGGTAHEFNNLLTMVLGYSELLQPLAESNQAREYVEKIRVAANKAASLTRQLLAFSRRQVLMPQVLDLNLVVAGTVKVLARVLGEGIETMFVSAPAPAWVRADSTQMEQIIANLVVNAREAMPHGGKLELTLHNVDLAEGDIHQLPGLVVGPYVLLRVSDTGVGMDPQVQARIFEPFFSTRQFGKAAGLGLATVYGIVSQSRGAIFVQSQPGAGTTFSIYLPRLTEDDVPEVNRKSLDSLRGAETILLVEDQPHLLELSREFLQRLNYKVLPASSGEEGIEVARQFAGEIDLLLTDVVMPGINGRQLALELKKMRSSIKVLYVSGFTDEVFENAGSPETRDALLEKPFQLEELARKIRELLDRQPK